MINFLKNIFGSSTGKNFATYAHMDDFNQVTGEFDFKALVIKGGKLKSSDPEERKKLYDPQLLVALVAYNRQINNAHHRLNEVTNYFESYKDDLDLNRIYDVAESLLQDKKLISNPDNEEGRKFVSLKDFNKHEGHFDFSPLIKSGNVLEHAEPQERRGCYTQSLLDIIEDFNHTIKQNPERRIEVAKYLISYENQLDITRLEKLTSALKNNQPLIKNPNFNSDHFDYH